MSSDLSSSEAALEASLQSQLALEDDSLQQLTEEDTTSLLEDDDDDTDDAEAFNMTLPSSQSNKSRGSQSFHESQSEQDLYQDEAANNNGNGSQHKFGLNLDFLQSNQSHITPHPLSSTNHQQQPHHSNMHTQRSSAHDMEGNNEEFPLYKVGEFLGDFAATITGIKYSAVNNLVFVATSQAEIIIFDATNNNNSNHAGSHLSSSLASSKKIVGRFLLQHKGLKIQVNCMDIERDKLIIGGMNGEVLLWDLSSRSLLNVWHDTHQSKVTHVKLVFLPNSYSSHPNSTGGIIYSTGNDGYFIARDLDTGKIVHSYTVCSCPISALCLETCHVVWLGSWDGHVRRLDLQQRACTLVLKPSPHTEKPIRAIALTPSPVPKKKKTGGGDKKKGGSSARTPATPKSTKNASNSNKKPTANGFASTLTSPLSSPTAPLSYNFDFSGLPANNNTASSSGDEDNNGAANGLGGGWEHDGIVLIFVSYGIGEIKGWDMRSGKMILEDYAALGEVCNHLSIFAYKIYAACEDHTIKVLDVVTGRLLETLYGHEHGVTSLAVVGTVPPPPPPMSPSAAKAAGAMSADALAEQLADRLSYITIWTGSYDGSVRNYKVSAIEAAITLKRIKQEEEKRAAWEQFLAAKATKKKAKGSTKKGKKGGKKKGEGAGAGDAAKKASPKADGSSSSSGRAAVTGSDSAKAAADAAAAQGETPKLGKSKKGAK